MINKLKEIWSDFMNAKRNVQLLLVASTLATLILATVLIAGCGYNPSQEYVQRMDERASLHFPRYEYLVQNATQEQLEQILGEKFDGASGEDIGNLKQSLVNEIKAWKFLIEKNNELIKKGN